MKLRKPLAHVQIASGLFPDNAVTFLMCSWCFVGFGANKFNDLANKRLAPKAEVTGSNPVGCVNYFNWLDEISAVQKPPFPQFVLRIRSCAVPGTGRNCSTSTKQTSLRDAPVTFRGEIKWKKIDQAHS